MNADAIEIPQTEPQLFAALLDENTISSGWIEPAARSELSPGMLRDISARLKRQGGAYAGAQRTPTGWLLKFKNGTVRSRIIRSKSGQLVGVFFSGLE